MELPLSGDKPRSRILWPWSSPSKHDRSIQPQEVGAEEGEEKPVMRRDTSITITHRDWHFLSFSVFKDLPESICGAAMMAIIRSTQTYHTTVHGVTFSVCAGLVLNNLMQFYVLWCTKLYICVPAVTRVQALYARFHEDVFVDGVFSEEAWEEFPLAGQLCQIPLSQPKFFVAVLVCWTATCWKDLLDSFRYMSLWWQLKPPSSAEEMTQVEFLPGHLPASKPLVPRAHPLGGGQAGRLDHVEDSGEYVVLTAADRKTKAATIGLILIPKIVIAVSLWWLGARWLVATTCFQDLLLNAVALAFITELDELLYHALVPEDIQVLVRSYKVSRSPQTHDQSDRGETDDEWVHDKRVHDERVTRKRNRRLLYRIAAMLVTMTVILGWPVVYMKHLQQVLPGYRWDVHAPCESRLEHLMLEI